MQLKLSKAVLFRSRYEIKLMFGFKQNSALLIAYVPYKLSQRVLQILCSLLIINSSIHLTLNKTINNVSNEPFLSEVSFVRAFVSLSFHY